MCEEIQGMSEHMHSFSYTPNVSGLPNAVQPLSAEPREHKVGGEPGSPTQWSSGQAKQRAAVTTGNQTPVSHVGPTGSSYGREARRADKPGANGEV